MAWPRTRKPSTRDLLRAEHRPHVPRSRAPVVWAVALLCVALSAVLAGVYLSRAQNDGQMRQRIEMLQAENASLAKALEERRLQGEEDRANREQLMRRIEVMSAEIKKLKTELAFFRQQKSAQ